MNCKDAPAAIRKPNGFQPTDLPAAKVQNANDSGNAVQNCPGESCGNSDEILLQHNESTTHQLRLTVSNLKLLQNAINHTLESSSDQNSELTNKHICGQSTSEVVKGETSNVCEDSLCPLEIQKFCDEVFIGSERERKLLETPMERFLSDKPDVRRYSCQVVDAEIEEN